MNLFCYSCNQGYVSTADRFYCPVCQKNIAIQDNILIADDALSLSSSSVNFPARNWHEILEELLKKTLDDYHTELMLKHIATERTGDWSYLVPVVPESTVLIMGDRWGMCAIPSARRFRQVVLWSSTEEETRLVNLRAVQEGLDNLVVLHSASPFHLPFREGTFDAVVMVALDEAIGTADSSRNAKKRMEDLLIQACRLLKKGGFLCVTARARSSFIRATDQRKGKLKYRDYKNLFKKAGFTSLEWFYPHGDLRNHAELVSLHRATLLRYFWLEYLYPRSALKRVLLKAASSSRLIKYFLPAYLITAQKSEGAVSI